jgi:hypothetical protein
MPAAHVDVPTARAARYLRQLCEHLGQVSHLAHGSGGPPQVQRVEWSADRGVIQFAGGRCTLVVADDALAIILEADDPDELRRLQQLIAHRLTTIGGRDQLTVQW